MNHFLVSDLIDHTCRIDVSGIIEKFNVYVMLAIIPRTNNIKRAF